MSMYFKTNESLIGAKVILGHESIHLRWAVTWDNTKFKIEKARILLFSNIITELMVIVHLPLEDRIIRRWGSFISICLF